MAQEVAQKQKGGGGPPTEEGGQDYVQATPEAAPGSAWAWGPPMTLQETLNKIRVEMIELEEYVPWELVRRNWRCKRSTWRRALRCAVPLIPTSHAVEIVRRRRWWVCNPVPLMSLGVCV